MDNIDNQFYKSAVNSLRNEIKSYVSQITAKLHFDITKSAVILSQSGNGYTILLDGNTYNNIPTDIKGAVFPINSVARIMIPQANYNNMFIMGLGEYTPNPTESNILMEQEAVATNTQLLSYNGTNSTNIDAPILTYTEITSSMTFNKNVITTGVEASHIWYNSTSKHVFGIIKTNDYITNNDTICTFPSPILSSSFSGACGIGISLNGTMDIASFESGSIKSTQNLLYPQNTLYASDGINPTGTTTSFGIAYNISFNY